LPGRGASVTSAEQATLAGRSGRVIRLPSWRAEARVKGDNPTPALPGRRLDQWLWLGRIVKSRSRAARLCVTGVVTVNRMAVRKPNHILRIGDILVAPQGAFCRV
jgi:ribosomal protein S4